MSKNSIQAVAALKLLSTTKVIIRHYQTFPLPEQDAAGFVNLAEDQAPDVEMIVSEPGEAFTLK